MLKLIEKKSKTKFNLIENWEEMPFGVYSKVLKKGITNEEVACLMSGLELEVLLKLGAEFIEMILDKCSWLGMAFDSAKWEASNSVNIREQTFGQLIELEGAVKSDNKIHETIKIYFVNLQPNEMQLGEIVPLANNIWDQLEAYLKIEIAELGHNATGKQVRAGIEKFNQFGRMNTIDTLAGGDVTKYDRVLEIDVNTVFIKLKHNKVSANYEKNYRKILEQK